MGVVLELGLRVIVVTPVLFHVLGAVLLVGELSLDGEASDGLGDSVEWSALARVVQRVLFLDVGLRASGASRAGLDGLGRGVAVRDRRAHGLRLLGAGAGGVRESGEAQTGRRRGALDLGVHEARAEEQDILAVGEVVGLDLLICRVELRILADLLLELLDVALLALAECSLRAASAWQVHGELDM
jgi:hypothetical protein